MFLAGLEPAIFRVRGQGKIYKVIHTKVKLCLVRRSRRGNLRKSGYIRSAKDAFPKWVSIQTSLWEYE